MDVKKKKKKSNVKKIFFSLLNTLVEDKMGEIKFFYWYTEKQEFCTELMQVGKKIRFVM